MTLRSPSRKRKPSSSSSQEIVRDENGSSIPSLSTHGKKQKASSKKRKREQEDNGIPTSTEKKSRVFTLEDEIAILQGMFDSGLSIATKELCRFLEGKLSGDFSNLQLSEKIRRLKEKFFKNMDHSDSLKTHDALVFDLCNRIWGKDKVLVTDSNKKKMTKKKKNLPRNLPMKDAGEDVTKEKLLELIACIVKKYEMKAELAKFDYEQMMKE